MTRSWDEVRQHVAEKWERAKLGEAIIPDLVEMYQASSEVEQLEFELALRRWLRSDDAAVRFDAQGIVRAIGPAEFRTDLIHDRDKIQRSTDPVEVSEAERITHLIREAERGRTMI